MKNSNQYSVQIANKSKQYYIVTKMTLQKHSTNSNNNNNKYENTIKLHLTIILNIL